jgi:aspartate/methionine/tyrosine aminotransferase
MDFQQFLAWSGASLRNYPEAVCYSETRIERAFHAIRPRVPTEESGPLVHRCDLARLWCDLRDIPAESTRTTLICDGVRHALSLVLEVLARLGSRVAIPTDVYPVYWQIASRAAVETVSVDTFPIFDLRAILGAAESAKASAVLLPSPLKLHGRPWSEDEVAVGEEWLRCEPSRRLVLDGVYSFGLPVGAPTKRLLSTGQVLYLDSLSKGWLHEQILGVAIVPESDLGVYQDHFRDLKATQSKLATARKLMSTFAEFPNQLTMQIAKRRKALSAVAEATGLSSLPTDHGYLIAIEADAESLLREHSILAIPATAFGSSARGWSIASALQVGDSP